MSASQRLFPSSLLLRDVPEWRDLFANKRLLGFWLLVLAAVPVWIAFDPPGWDVAVYHNAMRALLAGHDPYADATAIQKLVHQGALANPGTDPPYSYVYSPLTLPLLRALGHLPAWFSAASYWLLYALAVLTEVWVGLCFTEVVIPAGAKHSERYWFRYLAPLAAFFPGLLANGILLSGNVAYLLYALVLGAAIFAWQGGNPQGGAQENIEQEDDNRHGGSWLPFYFAVLAASCVKAPLLSLVVLPIFSARRQWLPAGLTLAAGLASFAVQPLLWPSLFSHYLQAVELQFSLNRDFGCSPAGLFAGFLFDHHLPYSPGSYLFYLAYAVPILATLFLLSRRFLRGGFSLQQWLPVLLLGVILLNPRLIEYDVAPLALPLALIGWRVLKAVASRRRALLLLALFFLVTNAFGLYSWNLRKLIDGPLLVLFFAAGAWTLYRASRDASPAARLFGT